MVVPLKTIPVGVEVVPAGLPVGGGIVTTSACLVPAPLYKVERPVPLSLTHHGLFELAARPQGLTRSLSITAAGTAPSETRLVCVKRVCRRARAWMGCGMTWRPACDINARTSSASTVRGPNLRVTRRVTALPSRGSNSPCNRLRNHMGSPSKDDAANTNTEIRLSTDHFSCGRAHSVRSMIKQTIAMARTHPPHQHVIDDEVAVSLKKRVWVRRLGYTFLEAGFRIPRDPAFRLSKRLRPQVFTLTRELAQRGGKQSLPSTTGWDAACDRGH